MQENIVSLSIDDLQENPLNKRSMNDIDELAASIYDAGQVYNPILVYPNDETDEKAGYRITSGNRRVKALRILRQMYPDDERWGSVPCIIGAKPETEAAEEEQMLFSNIHRSSDDDLKNEIVLANNVYNTAFTKEERKAMREVFLERWKNKILANPTERPKYEEDPEGYTLKFFRPRCEYIKSRVSPSLSNTTINRWIREILNKEGESLDGDEKKGEGEDLSVAPEEKPKTKISAKKVKSAGSTFLNKFKDYIDAYGNDDLQGMYTNVEAYIQEAVSYMTDRDNDRNLKKSKKDVDEFLSETEDLPF